MPTGAKNVLYIRDLGMTTYNLLNFKMRLVRALRGEEQKRGRLVVDWDRGGRPHVEMAVVH